MKTRVIKRLSILLAVTLATQSAMGLEMFNYTVKAKSVSAAMQEETVGESRKEVTTQSDDNENASNEVITEETTEESTTETQTTEEPTTEPIEPPTTEEPTTVDYEIIDEVYKVKDGALIEYLGDKKDESIVELVIPAQVKTIKESIFEDCEYIKEVIFYSDSKLTTIEKYAFRNCIALEKISLPSTLKTIGYRAFGSCMALKKFSIPSSVTSGNQIFGTKGNVGTVTFGSKMKVIPNNILRNAYSVTSVILPSKVTSIGKRAFYNCTALKKITLPNTVTALNTSAFYNCKSMTKFKMSTNVTTIGMYVFKKCTSLTSITLYKNIKSIGDGAFSGDSTLVLKVYANSKGKAYARANKLKWDYTESEKKRRAANKAIYDDYINKIDAKDKGKYKLKYLSDYVPQGNCLIGKYLVVSMYHRSLSKPSVLVLYNKGSGKFVKTIVLPYYDHVGGVINVKGRLVVSLNNISSNDYLAVYSYSKIKKVKHGKWLKPAYVVKLSGRADFATYDGTYLWAGRSANSSYATMQGYKVKVKKKKLVFTLKYSYYVPSNTQGLAVQKISKTKRKFIFSQSYGRLNNSSIITYTKNINQSGGLGHPQKTLTVPSMLEGITLGNNKYLYMVFESGAGRYCGNPDNTSEIQIKNVCRIQAKKLGI